MKNGHASVATKLFDALETDDIESLTLVLHPEIVWRFPGAVLSPVASMASKLSAP